MAIYGAACGSSTVALFVSVLVLAEFVVVVVDWVLPLEVAGLAGAAPDGTDEDEEDEGVEVEGVDGTVG